MTFEEYQTHMSLWCIACSPLMIGCDVRNLDKESAMLLMNREVLAVNQDKAGIPGRRVMQYNTLEIWKKPLLGGSVAVALINRGSTGAEITLKACDIGMLDTPKVLRDLWAQQDIADFQEKIIRRVQPHQTLLLKVSQP
jgi:alpha-galactosidase